MNLKYIFIRNGKGAGNLIIVNSDGTSSVYSGDEAILKLDKHQREGQKSEWIFYDGLEGGFQVSRQGAEEKWNRLGQNQIEKLTPIIQPYFTYQPTKAVIPQSIQLSKVQSQIPSTTQALVSGATNIPSYKEWKDKGMTYGGGYNQWVKDYTGGKTTWIGKEYVPPKTGNKVNAEPAGSIMWSSKAKSDPVLSADTYTKAYNIFLQKTGGTFKDFQKIYGDKNDWFAKKPFAFADIDLNAGKDIIDDSDLPDDVKDIFNETVDNWDPEKEINMENVSAEFQKIKDKTIDPYFKELTSQFENDLRYQIDNLSKKRAQEQEVEGITAKENIRTAGQNLEASGMTFSGEGVRQLGGGGSAYSADQIPFGGNVEGLVPMANRLMSSSALARYEENRRTLGRAGEKTLGTAGMSGYGLPTEGDVTQGEIERDRINMLEDRRNALLNQEDQNYSYRQPLKYNLPNFS